jgi:hypothetical protein
MNDPTGSRVFLSIVSGPVDDLVDILPMVPPTFACGVTPCHFTIEVPASPMPTLVRISFPAATTDKPALPFAPDRRVVVDLMPSVNQGAARSS